MFVYREDGVKGLISSASRASAPAIMPSMSKALSMLAVLCAALALTACGSDKLSVDNVMGSDSKSASGADHEGVQVIEDWADTLSSGDVEGASGFFAVPSVVSNGTPPITLDTEAAVKAFNQSLPCGAELVKAVPDGDRIDATFRLTDRPGGDCGAGAGGLAGTAFEITDGKITKWERLDDLAPGDQKPTGPIV